jgi:hypothetical protein
VRPDKLATQLSILSSAYCCAREHRVPISHGSPCWSALRELPMRDVLCCPHSPATGGVATIQSESAERLRLASIILLFLCRPVTWSSLYIVYDVHTVQVLRNSLQTHGRGMSPEEAHPRLLLPELAWTGRHRRPPHSLLLSSRVNGPRSVALRYRMDRSTLMSPPHSCFPVG